MNRLSIIGLVIVVIFVLVAIMAPWIAHFWTVTWDRGDAKPLESSVISFPAMHLTVHGRYTNTAPTEAYRGAGHLRVQA